MKTKELIKQLQELDPEGELEVIANGLPIYFTEHLEAYWDGSLPMLIQDEALIGKCYSIIGYKYTDEGNKIRLNCVDLETFLLDNPDGVVDISEVNHPQRLQEMVDNKRKEIKDVIEKVDNEDDYQLKPSDNIGTNNNE